MCLALPCLVFEVVVDEWTWFLLYRRAAATLQLLSQSFSRSLLFALLEVRQVNRLTWTPFSPGLRPSFLFASFPLFSHCFCPFFWRVQRCNLKCDARLAKEVGEFAILSRFRESFYAIRSGLSVILSLSATKLNWDEPSDWLFLFLCFTLPLKKFNSSSKTDRSEFWKREGGKKKKKKSDSICTFLLFLSSPLFCCIHVPVVNFWFAQQNFWSPVICLLFFHFWLFVCLYFQVVALPFQFTSSANHRCNCYSQFGPNRWAFNCVCKGSWKSESHLAKIVQVYVGEQKTSCSDSWRLVAMKSDLWTKG